MAGVPKFRAFRMTTLLLNKGRPMLGAFWTAVLIRLFMPSFAWHCKLHAQPDVINPRHTFDTRLIFVYDYVQMMQLMRLLLLTRLTDILYIYHI